jgi:hypothetical protein
MISSEVEPEDGIDLFGNPLKESAKEENIVLELLLKSGYNLNVKAKIYTVNDNEFIICLEKVRIK